MNGLTVRLALDRSRFPPAARCSSRVLPARSASTPSRSAPPTVCAWSRSRRAGDEAARSRLRRGPLRRSGRRLRRPRSRARAGGRRRRGRRGAPRRRRARPRCGRRTHRGRPRLRRRARAWHRGVPVSVREYLRRARRSWRRVAAPRRGRAVSSSASPTRCPPERAAEAHERLAAGGVRGRLVPHLLGPVGRRPRSRSKRSARLAIRQAPSTCVEAVGVRAGTAPPRRTRRRSVTTSVMYETTSAQPSPEATMRTLFDEVARLLAAGALALACAPRGTPRSPRAPARARLRAPTPRAAVGGEERRRILHAAPRRTPRRTR